MMIKDALGNLVEVPKGKENLANECRVKYVLLLTRDDTTKPVTLLGIDEAIRVLKEGKFIIRPGSGPPEKWGQYGYEPFYNPYPPEHNLSAEEAFFRKLYSCGVSFYLLNTGTYEGKKQTIHQTHMYIRHIVED
jgi:ATP-dependent phosphoenolpyruvate carboxykinase